MNVIDLLDDRTRPKGPPIEGATEAHRAEGRRLAYIHQIHIAALKQTRAMMDRVEAGEAAAADLSAAVNNLEMLRNYRAFGSLCGRECQILAFHHQSEEVDIFPVLREKGGEGLKRVVDRLAAEHVVIHELLEKLAERTVALFDEPGPSAFAALREIFFVLYRLALSHFAYEEAELEAPLGYFNVLY